MRKKKTCKTNLSFIRLCRKPSRGGGLRPAQESCYPEAHLERQADGTTQGVDLFRVPFQHVLHLWPLRRGQHLHALLFCLRGGSCGQETWISFRADLGTFRDQGALS